MTDIATRIRERTVEWVENCLDPQVMAHAVKAVLDDLDRLSAHGDARIMNITAMLHRSIADELGLSDTPAAAPAESQLPVRAAGEPTLTDPLIISIGQELAGRVWDPPLPKLPDGQWMDIVELIARLVREDDADRRWVAAERRADFAADAADRGSDA